MTKNIAIFASGSGSNAENIIRYFKENESVKVKLVVSNRSDAFVLERAKLLGVPGVVCPKSMWVSGEEIEKLLKEYKVDLIVLAGFLLRIPDSLLHVYPNRIINIHPSLLPKYGGKGMYGDRVHEAVVTAREKESGITIHCLNEHFDEGEPIFQATCELTAEDTPEDVARKVHALEYEYYPPIIEKLLQTI